MSKETKSQQRANDAPVKQGLPSRASGPRVSCIEFATGEVLNQGALADDLVNVINLTLVEFMSRNKIARKDHPPLRMMLCSYYEGQQEVSDDLDEITAVVEAVATPLLSGQAGPFAHSTPDQRFTLVGLIDRYKEMCNSHESPAVVAKPSLSPCLSPQPGEESAVANDNLVPNQIIQMSGDPGVPLTGQAGQEQPVAHVEQVDGEEPSLPPRPGLLDSRIQAQIDVVFKELYSTAKEHPESIPTICASWSQLQASLSEVSPAVHRAPVAAPIDVYFDLAEFGDEEIAEMLGRFSDLYHALSGDVLVIEGTPHKEIAEMLDPSRVLTPKRVE